MLKSVCKGFYSSGVKIAILKQIRGTDLQKKETITEKPIEGAYMHKFM